MPKPLSHRRPLIEALEPRLLFSATADVAVFDDGNADGQNLAQAAAQVDLVSIYLPSAPATNESQASDSPPQAEHPLSEPPAITSVVFIDTSVDNAALLVEDARARLGSDPVAIVYLDTAKDGITQISDYLSGVSGLASVHIISHGSAGNLQLGTQLLNEGNINQFAEQLAGWQAALGDEADILLYACDLAANASGVSFLRQLSELTGADVAASNDLTGNGRVGADWDLEEKVGLVDTASLFSSDQAMQWQGVLPDSVRLYSGTPTHFAPVSSGGDWVQGISLVSTDAVDRIEVTIINNNSASPVLEMYIYRNSLAGQLVAAASVDLSGPVGTPYIATFDFAPVTFSSFNTYLIQFRTDGADSLVSLGYVNSDVISNDLIINGISYPGRDLSVGVIDAENRAPRVDIAIPDQLAPEAVPFTFVVDEFTFSDLDGDTLSYTATLANGDPLPAWLSFDGLTRTFSGVPDDGDVGVINVRVIATDTAGASVSDDFTLTVNNLPEAPVVLNPIADQTASGFTPFSYQFPAYNEVSPVFADPDVGASITSYRATLGDGSALPGWLNFDSATRTFSGIPTNADAGTLAIRLYATDETGLESALPDEFNIVISTSANDAPVNTVPGAQSTNEDTPLVFSLANANQIQIADADALSSSLQVTLSVASGVLTLAGTTGLSFTTGDGNSDATMVFTGSVASINTALATLVYTPTANYSGADSLTITTNDLGNSGTGGALGDSDTVAITVNPLNDAPTIAIGPATYNALEQLAIDLHGTGISLADADGDGLTITLTGVHTNTSLAAVVGTTGVVIVSGFNTNTLVLSGSLAQLNDLFAGNSGGALTYRLSGDTPAATDTLTISVSDGSLSANDTAVINITALNDAPANTVPGAQTTLEDTALVFSAGNGNQIQVDDLDVIAGDLEITLSVTNGTLTLAGVTGLAFTTGDGIADSTLVFRGNQTNVNAALATLTLNPVTDFSGAAVLTITTSDLGNSGTGGTLTDTDTVNITVTSANDAPIVANPIADQTATEDAAFSFQFAANTFADVDPGTNFVYSAQLAGGAALPAWLAFDQATRTFSGTPANGDVGSFSIEVIANDGNGGTVTDTFTITVANANDAPTVANPIADQTATEDAVFSFQFAANTFADVDPGTNFVYSAQLAGGAALPAWLAFDQATRTFSGTPANGDVGSFSIEVIANDGNGGTVTDTFTITVANANDAPTVANPIADQTATEDAVFNFQFAANTFADVDPGTNFVYSAQLAGGAALPAWLAFDQATRTFSGTPANGDVDGFSIEVIANDGNGGTVTDTFTLTVGNINDAPTVANPIADQTATEDAAFSFQFAANTFADVDPGTNFVYSAQLAGGAALPAWLAFDQATRTFSGTPANGDVGSLSIEVIANDGNGGTVTDTFIITVNNVNDAPTVANPIADQTATEDVVFNFQFAANTFADVDPGTNFIYSAQLAGGAALPAWLTFDQATRTFSGTPANGDVGSLSIEVIANDGNGGTVTDTFTITVANANDAPVTGGLAPVNNLEDAVGNLLDLSAAFSDEETPSNQLQYSVVSNTNPTLVSSAVIDAATGNLQLGYGANQFGTAELVIRAQDAQGASTETLLQVNIQPVNDTPVAIGIADMQVQAGASPEQLNLRNLFSDIEDAGQLNYQLTANSNPTVVISAQIDSVTGMMTLVFSPSSGGQSTISLRALDSAGAWVDSQFNVIVVAAAVPPVSPPVIPEEPESLPPTVPPPVLPPAELPTDQNPLTGPPINDAPLVIDSLVPATPEATISIPTRVADGLVGDNYADGSGIDDQSSRDYARAVEKLAEDNGSFTKLTASPLLLSLIAPDAGLAPWEAEEFDQEIRRLRAQMDELVEEEQDRRAVIAGITFSITTGLIVWSLRASSLLLTMMSMLPLWRGLDPLPILYAVDQRKKELEEQRKDRQREDKSAKEVGYLFDRVQNKESRP